MRDHLWQEDHIEDGGDPRREKYISKGGGIE